MPLSVATSNWGVKGWRALACLFAVALAVVAAVVVTSTVQRSDRHAIGRADLEAARAGASVALPPPPPMIVETENTCHFGSKIVPCSPDYDPNYKSEERPEALARLYEKQKRYDEAEAIYKRVLATQEQAFGVDHPDIVSSLHTLATYYEGRKKYSEAEALFKRAVAIRERSLKEKTEAESYRELIHALKKLAEFYDGGVGGFSGITRTIPRRKKFTNDS
jgi:tetratricopeptide (TPR) repeat protein